MNQEFKGTLKIELDENALSAKLRFTPDDKAGKHNIDSIRQLLQKENIVFGLNEVALKDAIQDFAEALEEVLSEPIAEGEEYNPGEGNVYIFSGMNLSPELNPVAEKIRSLNKAPKVYKTIRTTVKRDKRVKDKGLFKGSKEKIITVEEQIERKVAVDVSSEILEMGLFRKNDLICALKSFSGARKNGKNVFGQEIEPPPLAKEQYLLGRNIRKEKTDFFAETDGFVRIGENWIDLVPFSVHSWSVYVSENKADCFLSIQSGHKAAPVPSVSIIREAIGKLGYPSENLLGDDRISRLVREACQSGGKQEFCLTEDKDGEYEIEVNSLAIEANLHMRKGSGKGKKLDIRKIWAEVAGMKIKDFETERIKKEILDFNSSNRFETSILLARGEAPERGKDRVLNVDTQYIKKDEMQFILERMDHLKKTPNSFQDFPKDSIEQMALVKKGSQIFHLGKKSEGKNGRDIYGKSIPGIAGNDPVVRVYENINIQEGNAIAAIDGILDYSGKHSVYSLRVRKHKDARVLVTVSENKMTASISVLPPEGSGALPTKEILLNTLEEKGVEKGVSQEALNSILEQTGREELVTDVTVAESLIPYHGGKALKFLVDIQIGSESVLVVEEDDRIAEILTPGKDDSAGYNVLGESIFKDNQEISADGGIKEKEEEGKLYLKAVDKGLLTLEGNRLFVNSKRVVQGDLSRSTGNLQFPGTVEIMGSVLSGIYVNAGKDLKVRDVVEAALLSSNGSVLIGKGIKGDRKAVVRANKNINLGFAENSNLMSNGTINFKKSLMNCQIKCNGKILSKGNETRIIGGFIKSKNGLTAGSIGSERGTPTFISFGQDYLVEDQINVITKEIEQFNEKLKAIEEMMSLAEIKKQQQKLIALRKKKVQYLKLQEKKVVKNFLMKDKFELHFDSEIRVSGTLYAGTVFESHGRKLEIKDNMTSVTIYFDSNTGRIAVKKS